MLDGWQNLAVCILYLQIRHIELASILELHPLASLAHHGPPLIQGDVRFVLPRDDIFAASAARGGPLEGIVGHRSVETINA